MIGGIGLDLCEIARMETLLHNEHFLNRYFTDEEIRYVRGKGRNAAQTLAGLFAAKEALTKALGTGIVFDLKEIQILHDEAGQPRYDLSGEAKRLGSGDRFLLSVSHDGGMAAAFCVREHESACQTRESSL